MRLSEPLLSVLKQGFYKDIAADLTITWKPVSRMSRKELTRTEFCGRVDLSANRWLGCLARRRESPERLNSNKVVSFAHPTR